MAAHTSGELQVRGAPVGDAWRDPRRAFGRHGIGRFTHHREQHREIVWREGPHDVFLGAEFAQAEAVGIDIAQLADRAARHQLLRLAEDRVVLQQVADFGLGRHPLSVGGQQGKRLFDIDMLARFERGNRHIGMGFRRCRQRHAVNAVIREDILEAARLGPVLLRDPLRRRRVIVGHRRQRAQLRVIARKVLAPVADADLGDARVAHAGITFSWLRSNLPRVSRMTAACSRIRS